MKYLTGDQLNECSLWIDNTSKQLTEINVKKTKHNGKRKNH